MSAAPPLVYDPYDAEIDADPHPIWRRLRDETPLYYNAEHDFYALSRFDDVLAASSDWRTYSSARGTVLEIIDQTPFPPEGDPPGRSGGLMIFMDPPEHEHFRRLVNRAFTPRRVSQLEDRIRALCAQFLDALRDLPAFDYLEDFGAQIPTMVIGALLGVPEEDQNQLRIWGDQMMHYEPLGPSEEKTAAIASFYGYVDELLADRRANPRDDMTSDLIRAEIELEDGSLRRLTHEELHEFVGLLEMAGSETTARLLGWAAVLLSRHPDERAKLLEDPTRIPNAIEELLRYEAPSPIQARLVTHEVEWYGQTVPAWSKIALLTGSAGRDERKYPDPDRFDVTRSIDRHVSFGYGVHYCLGANLARLEARVAIEETLARFPTFTVDEDKVELVRTTTVRGPVHVPFAP